VGEKAYEEDMVLFMTVMALVVAVAELRVYTYRT